MVGWVEGTRSNVAPSTCTGIQVLLPVWQTGEQIWLVTMKVFFTLLLCHSGEIRDVVVESENPILMGDLAEALKLDIAPPVKWGVQTMEITPSANVFQMVHDGDVVACWTSTAASEDKELLEFGIELEIVEGPEAGKSWTLGFGRYLLGRGDEADVVISEDREVSRVHAALRVFPDGVDIEDLDSTNGVIYDGQLVLRANLLERDEFRIGTTVFRWTADGRIPEATRYSARRRVNFSRPPRLVSNDEPVTVRFPGKVPERQKSPFPLLAVLAPVVFGVAMVFIQHSITYLFFVAMSPLMAVANHFSTTRRGKGTYRTLKERFDIEVTTAKGLVAEAVAAEVSRLDRSYPGPQEIWDAVAFPNPRLWERRLGDADFLRLRFGRTVRPPAVVVTGVAADNEEDPLGTIDVPATLDALEFGVLGVAGSPRLTQAFVRWLVAQAAALHAPEDLVVTLLTESDSEADWSWVRWLPHTRPDGFAGVARVGSNAESIGRLARDIDAVVTLRATSDSNSDDAGPVHVIVLDASRHLEDVPALAHILRAGPAVGVVTICVGESAQTLPEECQAVATLSNLRDPQVSLRSNRSNAVISARADQSAVEWCDAFARFLAPIRLNRTHESAIALPNSVRLLTLLDLESPSGALVERRWVESPRSTRATIGVGAGGPMVVDLSADGPHGLVAGTTGSGKSELLQTLIASLAVVNRPDAMNFVLVDYKGGSAFKDCAQLPHTVGMVTDLDGHLTERALASLGAELRRRERLLQLVQAKDIEDYWRATDSSEHQSLARLVLVIDEFASLVEELPSFVEGLVDIARRGRSLGIHLVLATQRPSGVVSPAIKTNTNLRIAMRVTDAADSTDVIDSPLAARIGKEAPGRGYVRAGHERLGEFQAARVGGRRPVRERIEVDATFVSWQTLGERALRGSSAVKAEVTDLADLVSAVIDATVAAAVPPADRPWLEPLPAVMTVDPSWRVPDGASNLSAIFGFEDRPDAQLQVPAYVDLERNGHLLLVGDAGSGRSTFLRTLAAGLAGSCSARDVHLFGIDCGNGALLPMTDLPNCGAVVSRTEVERVDRLITRLLDEVARRQQVLSLGGFSSIADQRSHAAPEDRLPYIVVLVDRWEGFVAEFDALDAGRLVSSFLHLMKESPGVGVRIVVAGDRTTLSARFAALVESTIVLRLNDRTTYSMAGLNPRKLPEHVAPGRGFRGGSGEEIQIALLDPDPSGPAQAAAVRAVGARARARDADLDPSVLPVPIASLPQVLPLSALAARPEIAQRGLHVMVGVGGDRVESQWIDLDALGPGFIIGGPPRSGRSNALLVAVRSVLAQGRPTLILTSRESPLARLRGAPGVLDVVDGRSVTGDSFNAVLSSVSGPVVVAVDDAELLADAPVAESLTALTRTARDQGHAVILAGTTGDLASGYRGFAPEVRKSKCGLLLCPSTPGDGEMVGIKLSRASLFPGPPGRGILASSTGAILVQVPIDDEVLSS